MTECGSRLATGPSWRRDATVESRHRPCGHTTYRDRVDRGAVRDDPRESGRGVFIIYLGLVAGTLFPFWLASGSPAVSAVVILTLGGMHVLYDGFIWKRPVPGTGGMLTTITV